MEGRRPQKPDDQGAGDAEGLPAIRHLISEGISVNITLLFSQKVYVEVAEAYLSGLREYVRNGGDPRMLQA